MWRQRNTQVRFRPKDGMLVMVRARVGLYEPRGEYQLLVEHMEEAGEGALKREFEKLKAKLAAEGLFAAERKRPLPAVPHRIGVVTSPTGAAIHDILRVLRARFPATSVLVYPTAVQGAAAVPEIVRAIEAASRRNECDVLIVARGGGSLEDLWCFNDERVARAIAACRIPTVSGVGHEVDVTIADFVADVRAPTPSAAALATVPDKRGLLDGLGQLEQRIANAMGRALRAQRLALNALVQRLQISHPGAKLVQHAQRLDDLEQRLRLALRARVAGRHPRLGPLSTRPWRENPRHRLEACCGDVAPAAAVGVLGHPGRAGATPRPRLAHARCRESARDARARLRHRAASRRRVSGARCCARARGDADRSAAGPGPVASDGDGHDQG